MLVCFLLTPSSKAQDGGPSDDAQGMHGHGHAENHNMYKDWTRPDVGGDGRCHVCERNGSVLCFQPCDPKI